ncbi:MAG: 2-oxoacid:acceptor oxidoreductase family protein [Deltaproteobacteria bacterium]|nr:2-oxoacid:acceptor oxidoreductase family protein [Deltaproteobacteria bacterium]MBW2648619.1 2-oxoacid:acceptor oxidoreductase family protein [Deltaproteobacteria bacterium]
MAMHEVIWHGRGGQGVVLAAQILAEAAYIQGFRGVTSAPTFGPERRGAPLTASTRISDEPVRTFSQIASADIAVIMDESLLEAATGAGRIKKEGLVIVNTTLTPGQIGVSGDFSVATVDAAKIAREHHLSMSGAPVVNTPLLGALSMASGLVSLESIEKGIKKKMPRGRASSNFQAIRTAFERTLYVRSKE